MPRRKIRDKSSTYRNSYTEEANREYRDEEFHWKSINYKDWIVEKGVRKYRVKWKPSYYKHHYYESTCSTYLSVLFKCKICFSSISVSVFLSFFLMC